MIHDRKIDNDVVGNYKSWIENLSIICLTSYVYAILHLSVRYRTTYIYFGVNKQDFAFDLIFVVEFPLPKCLEKITYEKCFKN